LSVSRSFLNLIKQVSHPHISKKILYL
jgi:hypothetical protein